MQVEKGFSRKEKSTGDGCRNLQDWELGFIWFCFIFFLSRFTDIGKKYHVGQKQLECFLLRHLIPTGLMAVSCPLTPTRQEFSPLGLPFMVVLPWQPKLAVTQFPHQK